jgi:hypothetical protein
MNLLAVIQQGAGLVEVKVGVGGGAQIYPVPPGLVHPPCCETISQGSETIHWAQKVPLSPGSTENETKFTEGSQSAYETSQGSPIRCASQACWLVMYPLPLPYKGYQVPTGERVGDTVGVTVGVGVGEGVADSEGVKLLVGVGVGVPVSLGVGV